MSSRLPPTQFALQRSAGYLRRAAAYLRGRPPGRSLLRFVHVPGSGFVWRVGFDIADAPIIGPVELWREAGGRWRRACSHSGPLGAVSVDALGKARLYDYPAPLNLIDADGLVVP